MSKLHKQSNNGKYATDDAICFRTSLISFLIVFNGFSETCPPDSSGLPSYSTWKSHLSSTSKVLTFVIIRATLVTQRWISQSESKESNLGLEEKLVYLSAGSDSMPKIPWFCCRSTLKSSGRSFRRSGRFPGGTGLVGTKLNWFRNLKRSGITSHFRYRGDNYSNNRRQFPRSPSTWSTICFVERLQPFRSVFKNHLRILRGN